MTEGRTARPHAAVLTWFETRFETRFEAAARTHAAYRLGTNEPRPPAGHR